MQERMQDFALDAAWVRRSFDRAAPGFDAAAVLHTEVRQSLTGRLDLMAIEPRVILDAGAGTGRGSRMLKARYPKARVIALDASHGMLQVAARQQTWLRRFGRLQADIERMPLADGSIDLIFSNLVLHWCDPERALREFRRVLAPKGLLCFSTLGPDTLAELRGAWAQVDTAEHVHGFLDMHDIGDALVRAGLSSPVLDVERLTLRYADFGAVAADLRATGARNAALSRPRGLSSPRKFAAMRAAYERSRTDGRLPATCEVVFAHAWAPAVQASASAPSSTTLSLDDMKRQLNSRRR